MLTRLSLEDRVFKQSQNYWNSNPDAIGAARKLAYRSGAEWMIEVLLPELNKRNREVSALKDSIQRLDSEIDRLQDQVRIAEGIIKTERS